MTVKELKTYLDNFDPEQEVVIKIDNYAYSILDNIEERKIRAAFGEGFKAVVLHNDWFDRQKPKFKKPFVIMHNEQLNFQSIPKEEQDLEGTL